MALQTYDTPTRPAPAPVRHRCAGLPENARAHLVALPQGERVIVVIEFGDYAGQTRGGAFPYCPGCGAHASFLAAGGVR